jgi:chromosome segregation protein
MRLHKIKLSGFKSFVDPTTVLLPTNLTGVVGPNGCGKTNIIDAVRWVMGELSARHLRGDSMADVIFNGSQSRKPIGTAAVELLFDNSDGKMGGPYAGYSEISLKRTVSRDGTSAYFINGGRCRRKDITQLFLGTGLGARSYAIIEQGMISRIIEARSEDMRAFVEEAAGISLYKERRRETEGRIADARENLARLQDLRDEVDKQIRHLQRQANTARKFQELRIQERTLTAELLVLRLREIDSGVLVHSSAMRQRELVMQQALAEQRATEAAIERQREFGSELTATFERVQSRYYELGAEITRTEEGIRYANELRTRQQNDLQHSGASLATLAAQLSADQRRISELEAELSALEPEVARLRAAEQAAGVQLAQAEARLQDWQQRWELFNRELGTAGQDVQVEAARIEQFENQLLRLQAHADRLLLESEALNEQQAQAPLPALSEREQVARQLADTLGGKLADTLQQVQRLRGEQRLADEGLEQLRAQRDRERAELISLEALQQAAQGAKDPRAAAWLDSLGGAGGGGHQRLAATLEVASGWERAVETALGDYLQAVCVPGLDALATALGKLDSGTISFLESRVADTAGSRGTLAAQVKGPAAALGMLEGVRTARTLAEALSARRSLRRGESLITPQGEWLGSDWLRVSRGTDPHAGVLEREQRLKSSRAGCARTAANLQQAEQGLAQLRERAAQAERAREDVQAQIQQAQHDHSDARAQLGALRARLEETSLRGQRIETEQAEVHSEINRTRTSIEAARTARDAATQMLQRLDAQRPALEEERELAREHGNRCRSQAQSEQLALRDALIRHESRRSTHQSMGNALTRMLEQQKELEQRRTELTAALQAAEAPAREQLAALQEALTRRLDLEAELTQSRSAAEEAERELRGLEQRRLEAEGRVSVARADTEQARLAEQESRLRRESVLEQFAATHCKLEEITANLSPEAQTEPWELRLTEARAEIEKLGQVNLAAIDELKEQSERKTYLDRQYNDVNDALNTLDQAMRKMDRETRVRFEDTFNQINLGLKDKFPRLFGGGHAYLELVGDDPLSAGVAVMARPPGKRNSTISQLSGGEKALTAVALVFSIFDLNPAPFCLLDEVDAPLDEQNVGRYCEIVRDMAARVQFIFITHNKSTMELASQLVGVTMHEPGVSRLVTVDVDEAVRLAAV